MRFDSHLASSCAWQFSLPHLASRPIAVWIGHKRCAHRIYQCSLRPWQRMHAPVYRIRAKYEDTRRVR